jgi:biofilm PGA synthesis N-glycosyltransferase PgaC
MIVFFSALIIIAYIFIGYPLCLFIGARLFNRRVETADIYPKVSLIISAYNEEKVIREKLENSLALDYPKDKLEIIVASESNDNTNAIVKEYADKGIILDYYADRQGKRATLFRAVPKVEGEIIVLSDANAQYQKDSIKKLVRNFNDKRIGCVSGRLRYKSKENSTGESESSYWEFDMLLKLLSSKMLVLGGGVNGSIMAFRKELYNPIDKNRGDDFEIANRIEIAGWGVILESEAVSFEEASETTKQEFSRKVRLAAWNLKSTLMLLGEALMKSRGKTVFILFSHRLLRYLMPIWVVLLFIANIVYHPSIWGILLIVQIVFYILALIGYILEKQGLKVGKIFLLPLYFCMLNIAAAIAISKNIMGDRTLLWEKAR